MMLEVIAWFVFFTWCVTGLLTLLTEFKEMKNLKVAYGLAWFTVLWLLLEKALGV